MKLDLETLKQVKFTFDIHSDHSTMCNGYRSLCKMIEGAEKETNQSDFTESLPFEFVKWYSGMEGEKIIKAFQRWKDENNNF